MVYIKSSFANCKTCKLYRNPGVILETNVDHLNEVEIIFIGENPGKVEIHLGRPFVGPCGTFLRKYIQDILDHHKYIITNIVYCSNIVKGYTCNPTKKHIDLCSLNTYKMINMLKPTLVVMLGKSAVNGLMKNIVARGNMSDIAGSFYKLSNEVFSNSFITYHPSYVMNASKKIKNDYEGGFLKVGEYLLQNKKRDVGNIISKESYLNNFGFGNYYEQLNINDIMED